MILLMNNALPFPNCNVYCLRISLYLMSVCLSISTCLCCTTYTCTALVVQKCIWEAINVVQYLWIPLIDKSYFYNNDDSCAASNNAAIWAFISQVSHMAGNLQLLILAVDLRRSSSNPFEAYQLRERYYLGFVWLISLSTGLILLALGGDTYGLASNMTCWIQVRSTATTLLLLIATNAIYVLLHVCAVFALTN